MKRLLLAAAALFCAFGFSPITQAQTTTITASSISMGGTPISAGTVMFTPVNSSQVPIAFVTGGGGLNGVQSFTCTIASGAISGSCTLPDSTLTTPVNMLYQVLITNTALTPNKSFSYVAAGISGTSWALDQYAPPSNIVNVQSIIGYSGTTVPGSCVAPAFFTQTTTGQLYSCIAGTYTLVSPVKGESVVTFSATPALPVAALSDIITLTGNVTGPTIVAGAAGQKLTLSICQDATGSRTFAWPANIPGGPTIGSTASKCSSYILTYSTAKTEWLVGGVTNQ